jgi:hypothetical protein
MADYLADVKKFASNVDEDAVAGIVRHLGIALRSRDASLVSCSDPKELARVRDGFCRKKLALPEGDDAVDASLQAVCEKMKADKTKARVTFYYLLAEHYGKLALFHKKK